ncbi:MAG: AAA family ATPase [Pseudomonadota bacterium]|jgi:chromosome partitioning protein|nr:AAA family ATPase [Pseudomonadota bacterium]
MKTIAIISQKGGSGKTTIAVHLAVCTVRAGKVAAIIDLDPQASAVEWQSRRQADTPEVITSTPERLASLLKQANENGADLAIIDTAPHSDRAATIAADLADVVLIPCRPAAFDIAAIGTTLNILKLTNAKERAVILLNAVPPRGSLTNEAEDGLSALAPVVPIRMAHRAAYSHAVNDGRSVEEYDPHGKAAAEIRDLYKWIMKA